MAIPQGEYGKIAQWHRAGVGVVLVRVAGARGSTPRDTDAAMAVTAEAIVGTIGGGQLEWMAIARAREMLAAGETAATMDIPLGPEIGQCCGGRVELSLSRLTDPALADMQREAEARLRRSFPMCWSLAPAIPARRWRVRSSRCRLQAMLIDERRGSFDGFSTSIETVLTPVPEQAVRDAPPGSAFVAMTHSHSQDFLIIAEALKRGDAAYCGMIGSATKRAVFPELAAKTKASTARLPDSLTCPIGGTAIRDKRPEVIAAMTAAEILTALYASGSSPIVKRRS